METLFLAYQNLGDYQSLSRWLGPCFRFKQLLLQLVNKSDEKRKQNEEGSRWQRLHEDIMEMIVPRLNISDRIRLGIACKSWNSVCVRGDIRSAQLQVPWLVLPHGPDCKYLCFSSLAEGKVHTVRLPKPVQGGWFYGSSRGWLIMIKEKGLNSTMYLVNPISGARCKLPPLATIPSFRQYVETEWNFCGTSAFFRHIVLSTSDIRNSACKVAAVFNMRSLVVCRPGDQTWTVVHVLDSDVFEHHEQLLFSSTGKLYSLVFSIIRNGLIQPRTIKIGDKEVELILVYPNFEQSENYVAYHNNYSIDSLGDCSLFLLESIHNEVLVIHQLYDVFRTRRSAHDENDQELEGDLDDDDNDDDDEEEAQNMQASDHEDESEGSEGYIDDYNNDDHDDEEAQNMQEASDHDDEGEVNDGYDHNGDEEPQNMHEAIDHEEWDDDNDYLSTKDFRVYKIDVETGNFLKLQSLGDQILFLTDYGSISLRASDFKELEKNSIYFATNGTSDTIVFQPFTSREIGVFYLDNGRIKRSFPSVKISTRSRMSWFTPSFK